MTLKFSDLTSHERTRIALLGRRFLDRKFPPALAYREDPLREIEVLSKFTLEDLEARLPDDDVRWKESWKVINEEMVSLYHATREDESLRNSIDALVNAFEDIYLLAYLQGFRCAKRKHSRTNKENAEGQTKKKEKRQLLEKAWMEESGFNIDRRTPFELLKHLESKLPKSEVPTSTRTITKDIKEILSKNAMNK